MLRRQTFLRYMIWRELLLQLQLLRHSGAYCWGSGRDRLRQWERNECGLQGMVHEREDRSVAKDIVYIIQSYVLLKHDIQPSSIRKQ